MPRKNTYLSHDVSAAEQNLVEMPVLEEVGVLGDGILKEREHPLEDVILALNLRVKAQLTADLPQSHARQNVNLQND